MSYYKTINGVRYDARLILLAEELISGKGDGQISQTGAEWLKKAAGDSGHITKTERNTLTYLLNHFNFTDKAKDWLRKELKINALTFEESIESIVHKKFGLRKMVVEIEGEEIKHQSVFEGQVDFKQALEIALESILSDGKNDQSPRVIVAGVNELLPEENPADEVTLRQVLRSEMEKGKFILLPNFNLELV